MSLSWGALREEVIVVDLLVVNGYHTLEVAQGLRDVGVPVRLAVSTFSADPLFAQRTGFVDTFGVSALTRRVAAPGLRRTTVRLLEYILNWLFLVARCVLRPPRALHVQWLPLLDRSRIELVFLWLIRRRGIRVVFTVHNASPHDATPAGLDRRLRAAIGVVDALICHSDAVADELHDRLSLASRPTVNSPGPLFSGIAPLARPAARSTLGQQSATLAEAEIVVVFLGTIRPYKGVVELLTAWSGLGETIGRRAMLYIGGPGEGDYARRVRLLAASIPNVYCDIRSLSFAEVWTALNAADVCVFPYLNGSQSSALWAAAGLGRACVVTSAGGISEGLVHGTSALLVEPGDVAALREALAAVASDSHLRETLGQNIVEVFPRTRWCEAAKANLPLYDGDR